jgi:hypothetical protein
LAEEFRSDPSEMVLNMNGEVIKIVKMVKILGQILEDDEKDTIHLLNRIHIDKYSLGKTPFTEHYF